ncbi:MAG TPA: aminotransferase class I/II-fold pyridoxal phosphate-dependent enzyme [Stellaceae bacterium]|nr:aminotransferase class I/II-fold pyridoxal phosphate-dependent enzyme [Stellaceae bacterium]
MPLSAKYQSLEEYPFTRLNKLLGGVNPRANEAPILMSVGEPQHEPPPFMAKAIADNAHLWNRYPAMAGTPALRATAAAWLTERYRLPTGMLDPERHVMALSGTKEGLYLVASLVVPESKAGRRPIALMPNPYYLVYSGGAHMAGAETMPLDATKATGFLPDLDAIPEDVLARTALFYLCSPANPQGACADLAYFKKLIGLARRHDFVLAVDECYSEIYDRVPPVGGLEACAALGGDLRNVLVFHSLSKRSNAAGLRIGLVAGDPDLLAKFGGLRSYGGAQAPLPLQEAAVALWRDEAHVEANRARYRRKFDICEEILKNRFGFYRPAGGFFLWLDVGDGEEAALKLWREAGLRSLPGPYIGRANAAGVNPGQNYIRLAIVHDDDTIAAGMRRLLRVL